MFVEIPGLSRTKPKEIFDILKVETEIPSEELKYYPVSDEIVYVIQPNENVENNLLLPKLVKKLISINTEYFIAMEIMEFYEDDTKITKLGIFQYYKGEFEYHTYKIDVTVLLILISDIQSNKERNFNDLKIFYVEHPKLRELIEKVIEITGIDKDIFVRSEGVITDDDIKEIVRNISLKDEIKEKFQKIESDILSANNKKQNIIFEKDFFSPDKVKKYTLVGGLIVAVVLGGIVYYSIFSNNENNNYQVHSEKIKIEKTLKKAKENYTNFVLVKELLDNNAYKVDIDDKRVDIELPLKEYKKLNWAEGNLKYIYNNTVFIHGINKKKFIKNNKIKIRYNNMKAIEYNKKYNLEDILLKYNIDFFKNKKSISFSITGNKKRIIDILDKVKFYNGAVFNIGIYGSGNKGEYILNVTTKNKSLYKMNKTNSPKSTNKEKLNNKK